MQNGKLWQMFANAIDKEIARVYKTSVDVFKHLTEKTEVKYTNDHYLVCEIDVDRFIYLNHIKRTILFTALSRVLSELQYSSQLSPNLRKIRDNCNGISILGV